MELPGITPSGSASAPPVRDAQDRADIVAYLVSLWLHNRPLIWRIEPLPARAG
jgi:hypothetical protein